MKKIIFLLLAFTVLMLKAQTYIPFPNDTATWGIKQTSNTMSGQFVSYFKEIQKSDSIINGVKFHKVYKNSVANSNLMGLYRESNKKIYAKIYPYPDTNQVLIYDFNLNIGDTFYDKYKYLSNDIVWKYKVQTITTTTLTTNPRKQYDLTLVGGPNFPAPCSNQTWLEGIGSLTTFFNAREGSPCYVNSLQPPTNYQLTCFKHKFIQYMTSSCLILNIHEQYLVSHFLFYPNPSSNVFAISSRGQSSNFPLKLTITNLIGQIIQEIFILTEETIIELPQLSTGLFFATISFKDKPIYKTKIIKL